MKKTLYIVSILVGLLGLVWIGQGIGFIKGSVMTDDSKWAYIGAIMVAVSAILLFIAGRRKA